VKVAVWAISCAALLVAAPIGSASGEKPRVALQRMLDAELSGDPTVRIDSGVSIRRESATDGDPGKRSAFAFDLDADPLLVVTSWEWSKNSDSRCEGFHCTLAVVLNVVGDTAGEGVPSWISESSRELRCLSSPERRLVSYSMILDAGIWKIANPPLPAVRIATLKSFFRERLVEAGRHADREEDPRAMRNRAILEVWRKRQLAAMDEMIEVAIRSQGSGD
jgi:hypothetical protein